MSGHLLPLPHLAGVGALTDGATVANSIRGSVCRILATEVISFHNTSEALTLRPPRHLDFVTDFELGHVQDLTDLVVDAGDLVAEFLQLAVR